MIPQPRSDKPFRPIEQERAHPLHELIKQGALPDQELRQIALERSPEEQRAAAETIFEQENAIHYVQTFYECWSALSPETKDEMVYQIREEASERMLLVLPFVNLEDLKEQVISPEGYATEKNLFKEWTTQNISHLRLVAKSIITYRNNHPNAVTNDAVTYKRFHRTPPTFVEQASEVDPTNELFSGSNFFLVFGESNNHSPVLWPYAKKLIDAKLLNESNIEHFFGVPDHFHVGNPWYFDFKNQEEANVIAQLTQKHPSTKEGQKTAFHMRLHLQKKAAGYVASTFSSYKSLLKDPVEHLIFLKSSDVPIEAFVKELELSPTELTEFMKGSRLSGEYLSQYILYSQETFTKTEHEQFRQSLTNEIIHRITTFSFETFIEHAHTYFPLLTQDQQQNIVEATNSHLPEAWLSNPGVAIEQGVTLERLVELAEESEISNYKFYELYPKLRETINQNKSDSYEHLGTQLDEIKQAKLNGEPFIALLGIVQQNQEIFFSETSLDDFIEKHLSEQIIDPIFFCHLLLSEHAPKFKDTCTEVIESRIDLLPSIVEQKIWDHVLPLKTDAFWFSYFTEHVAHFPFTKYIFESNSWFDLLRRNESEAANLFELLAEKNRSDVTVLMRYSLLVSHQNRHDRYSSKVKTFNRGSSIQKNLLSTQKEIADLKHAIANEDRRMLASLSNGKEPAEALRILEKKLHLFEEQFDAIAPHERPEILKEELKKDKADYNNLIELLDPLILELCETNPGFVFKEQVYKIRDLEEDVHEYVRRDAQDYFRIYPEDLSKQIFVDSRHRSIFKEILGDKVFSELFAASVSAITFSQTHSGERLYTSSSLSKDYIEQCRRIDPLGDMAGETDFPHGYYETILPKLETFSWYPFFKSQIAKMVDHHTKRFGQIIDTEDIPPDQTFLKLVNRIGLLENSDFVQTHRSTFESLNPVKHEKIFTLMEFALRYQVDRTFDFDPTTLSPDELESVLEKAIIPTLKELFGFSANESIDVNNIDGGMLFILATYFRKKARHESKLQSSFQEFFSHLIDGTFIHWRAWGVEKSPTSEEQKEQQLTRMKHERLLPSNVSVPEYEVWNEPLETRLEEVMDFRMEHFQHSISQILLDAISDGHVTEADITSYEATPLSHLLSPIQSKLDRISDIKKQFAEARVAKKTNPDYPMPSEDLKKEWKRLKSEVDAHIETQRATIQKHKIQAILSRLLRGEISQNEIEEQSFIDGNKRMSFHRFFKEAEEIFKDQKSFLTDIKRIERAYKNAKQQLARGSSRLAKSKFVVTDQVDPHLHMTIGAFPVPSCQHFNSDDNYNKGLLSYAIDPSVRILRIMDEHGAVIARSVLRLTEDAQGQTSLLMERVYSLNSHPNIPKLLEKVATKKAQAMGVDLFRSKDDVNLEELKDISYKTLTYTGGRAPYMYTDSGSGLQENNRVKIPKTIRV